jgi:hypothetical protein
VATPFSETVLTISAGLVTTFMTGPYWGAFVIAFVASFTRTAFEDSCGSSHTVCFRRWMRFLMMAMGVSFLMVSVAAWMLIPTHPSIVFAGFFACFAEETLTALKHMPKKIIEKFFSEVTK